MQTASPSSFRYRPDIDGLRALAVIPVLLYHARLGCTGGFVGVDVFFVISGYVISSIILREVAAGSFRMLSFWERRVRRIMPALSVVMAAVLVAAWCLCLPQDFQIIGKSVMAQALMASNFYFCKGGSYFGPESDSKPLLHTWSLAVEEQFYFLLPLLLMALIHRRPASWQRWLLGAAAGSLALGVFCSDSPTCQRMAFYLLPARAWELLTGVLLAVYGGRFPAGKRLGETSGLTGLALIFSSVFVYNSSTPFPGLAALAPCLGAALIIASSGARVSAVGRLLSFRPLVFIGLVSYPLYLWHWPLLVLAQYSSADELSAASRALLLLVSLLLAVLTWRFVERPFRQRLWLGRPAQIFTFAGITTGALIALALSIYGFAGFPSRFPARALSYSRSLYRLAFADETTLERASSGRFMELGSSKSSQPISLFVWGDSHAKAAAPALDTLCREYSQRGVISANNATAPVLNYVSPHPDSLRDMSPRVADSVLAFIAQHHVKNVIIIAKWNMYPPTAEFKDALHMTVRAIMNSGARVCLLKDVPEPGFDVPRLACLTSLRGGDFETLGISREKHRRSNAALEQTFEQLARMGATVLDPADLFLNSRGNYGVIKNDEVLYFDNNHLTSEGAARLVPLLRPMFEAQ